jgi:hypothetical protein
MNEGPKFSLLFLLVLKLQRFLFVRWISMVSYLPFDLLNLCCSFFEEYNFNYNLIFSPVLLQDQWKPTKRD